MSGYGHSFASAYACLSAWADLLDRINVFPVADGDTGTNLRISLSPLRNPESDDKTLVNLLARSATGNSGNIAAAFLREFCQAKNFAALAEKAALGRDKAWQAVVKPCQGTMLSVFDSLAEVLSTHNEPPTLYPLLSAALQKAVLASTQLLPDLQNAGVVDAGALAMYIFFEGFFRHLSQQEHAARSIFDIFPGRLAIDSAFYQEASDCHCVDVVLQLDAPAADGHPAEDQTAVRDRLAKLGDSLVVVQDASFLKIHMHTPDPGQLRSQLVAFGNIVQWSDAAMAQSRFKPAPPPGKKPSLHIVTDAAGSLPRAMAQDLGITLLDSYIIVEDDVRPESLYSAEELYLRMRKGGKITTAQASNFERHQHYQSICQEFGPSLYLCVGAAFTGNYHAAMAWKEENDLGGLFTVINTGAASGRLALIALLTARHAKNGHPPDQVMATVQHLLGECAEYVFINELKYLVAGGRVSRLKGFFGDLLRMKPIVTPSLEGVQHLGVAHNSQEQLAFALEKLQDRYSRSAAPVILLQYSDNEPWVAGTAQPQVRALLPAAEILLTPLSLTSGVHMGPGTWSMAVASPLLPAEGPQAQ